VSLGKVYIGGSEVSKCVLKCSEVSLGKV